MIMIIVYLFAIANEWLNVVNFFNRLCRRRPQFHRWWVKLHIRQQTRDLFGSYRTLFLYFMYNDHEEFYKMTRMSPDQFNILYGLIAHRLQKTSIRKPLPQKLRLAVTLK